MRRARFVAHQNMADVLIGEQFVVNRQNRAAGIAEDEFDALPLEAFDQDGSAAALGSPHYPPAPLGHFRTDQPSARRWGL